MVAQQAGTASGSRPGVLLSGIVPPLADAYYPRDQTGLDLASSLRPGMTAVLVHGAETEHAPADQGGTGKTQLAVEFTHTMWNTRAVEILLWVNAGNRESIVTGFAQAANTVDASQPDEGAEAAAARFVSWLDRTRRPWAVVIDDLADLSDLEELWPAGASGRVVITTRLPLAARTWWTASLAPRLSSLGCTRHCLNSAIIQLTGVNGPRHRLRWHDSQDRRLRAICRDKSHNATNERNIVTVRTLSVLRF